jgi:hypothetical protein
MVNQIEGNMCRLAFFLKPNVMIIFSAICGKNIFQIVTQIPGKTFLYFFYQICETGELQRIDAVEDVSSE